MKRTSTLRDIADELGLSHTTVSRALNDHPQINVDTKARVREAATRGGYVVNSSARSLRGSPSTLVGLVIPDVRNTFYVAVARMVAETLAQSSYQLVLAVTEDDPAREYRDLRALAEARAAGVIVVLSPSPTRETLELLRKLYTIQLFRHDPRVKSSTLSLDDEDAIFRATRHLVALGHRRLGYLGSDPGRSTGAARLKGFERACAEAGIQVPASRVALGPANVEFGRAGMNSIFGGTAAPTGLVVGSVEQVLGCAQWLDSHGLHCPDDLSVVGFGDPPWFELIHGGLSTMRLPVAEVAAAAAQLVLESAAGDAGRSADLRFPSELIIRNSTGKPRKSRLVIRP